MDYDATVWVNGQEVGRHRGGFTPITCDLGAIAQPGETITIVVRARDDHRQPQPRGKQSRATPLRRDYTRTTGIWQTVWLEPVPPAPCAARASPRTSPRGLFRLEQPVDGRAPGCASGRPERRRRRVAAAECPADADFMPALDLPSRRAPPPVGDRDPHLYDVEISCSTRRPGDRSGRELCRAARGQLDGKAIKINGQPVFQRLVLDQGYYPDGILTAPSDAALIADIELSMEAGFNGARLHQKVFEERFLYHADRLGYLVWGEFADWGCAGRPAGRRAPKAQRDLHHPVAGGARARLLAPRDHRLVPLERNLAAPADQITELDDVTRGMFLATKAMDPTRPVLDASGYSHRVPGADVYDCHDYTQDPEKFAANHAGLAEGKPFESACDWIDAPGFMAGLTPGRSLTAGSPSSSASSAASGGTRTCAKARTRGATATAAQHRGVLRPLRGAVRGPAGRPIMFGYCYTQLTDVFQEQNGIYTSTAARSSTWTGSGRPSPPRRIETG